VDELRERMSDLAVFGIVSESAPWTVARGYWPAIAAAAAEEGDDEGPLGDLFGEGEPHWLENVMGQLGVGDDQMQQIRNILGGR
jgi:Spy/CpxP family protein refolding chaperone